MSVRNHLLYPSCIILALLMTALSRLSTFASSQPPGYKQLINLESGRLLEMADSLHLHGQSDSALVAYTIITSRYDKDLTHKDLLTTAIAYEGLWSVYFLYYSNFAKAYECVRKEQTILRELGMERPRVYLNLGALYETVAVLTHDKESERQALEYYRHAFNISLRQCTDTPLTTSFANLIITAFNQRSMETIKRQWDFYSHYKFRNPSFYVEYNKLLYKGLVALSQHNFGEARQCFNAQLKLMGRNVNTSRYRVQALIYLAQLESLQQHYRAAIILLRQGEKELEGLKATDALAEVYDRLSTVCQDMGNHQEALRYRTLFLETKDEMMNTQMLRSFGQLNFQEEVDKMTSEIIEAKEVEERHRHIFIAIIALSLLMTAIAVYIYRKNRRLSASFHALYEKNVELLQAYENLETVTRTQHPAPKKTPERSPAAAAVSKNNIADGRPANIKTDNDTHDPLADTIRDVMRDPATFCSPNFTAEHLASIVGCPYKTLSATIHDTFHCNFNTLLNQVRVEEACRRINSDMKFRGYTVEGMAQSMGYRSRNSFTAAFKRITGLYPSEYIREAKAKE